jgi:hypothetical protein
VLLTSRAAGSGVPGMVARARDRSLRSRCQERGAPDLLSLANLIELLPRLQTRTQFELHDLLSVLHLADLALHKGKIQLCCWSEAVRLSFRQFNMIAANRTNQQALPLIRKYRNEKQREPNRVLAKMPGSLIVAIAAVLGHSRSQILEHRSSPTEDNEGTPPAFLTSVIVKTTCT